MRFRLTFASFMAQVEEIFLETFGLTSDDFPNYRWFDSWENDNSPQEAFDDFCEYNI